MDPKAFGRALLFPHIAILLFLTPVSIAFLVASMVTFGSESPIAIVSYVLAAYTLTAWCARAPRLYSAFKHFKAESRLARIWQSDERLRVKASLYGALAGNTAYALFQLWLGVYHRSFWFYSFAAYYILLAAMRASLALHTRAYRAGERLKDELVKYRTCGWVLLSMNLALSIIVFFMVYWNRTFVHHEITTIAMAAYTFTSFSFAIVNIVKYRKYNSPVYSASKSISLAAACVSMLTLESTMLTTWGQGESDGFRRIMLASTGAAIAIFFVVMAIYMIAQGSKGLAKLKEDEKTYTVKELKEKY